MFCKGRQSSTQREIIDFTRLLELWPFSGFHPKNIAILCGSLKPEQQENLMDAQCSLEEPMWISMGAAGC